MLLVPGSRFRAPSCVQLYRDVSDGARDNEQDAPGDEINQRGWDFMASI